MASIQRIQQIIQQINMVCIGFSCSFNKTTARRQKPFLKRQPAGGYQCLSVVEGLIRVGNIAGQNEGHIVTTFSASS